MQQYSFTVKHIKGEDNVLADALSMLRAHVVTVGTQNMREDWIVAIKQALKEDSLAPQDKHLFISTPAFIPTPCLQRVFQRQTIHL